MNGAVHLVNLRDCELPQKATNSRPHRDHTRSAFSDIYGRGDRVTMRDLAVYLPLGDYDL